MENKKFELTSETKIISGKRLFRIRALMSFGDVKKGQLGGFVEKEQNISVDGNAWVYGDADIYWLKTDKWSVTITTQNIAIGCELHSAEDWFKFKDSRIKTMDSNALEWWKRWKPIIKAIYGQIGQCGDQF